MNRLKTESSAYLKQHENDPIDWFSWGQDAFAQAKERQVPILLSVGFASCHWCHVMAHESFADPEIADIINNSFVAIKVDREEHVDVDTAFMEAVFAMSGQGGWPMTVFLTPDAKPFVAATYVPREPTTGHPGFVAMLNAVSDTWNNQRDQFMAQANELNNVMIARLSLPNDPLPTEAIDITALMTSARDSAIAELSDAHDSEWGGFGAAPKFPRADILRLLLRSDNKAAHQVAVTTLDAMAAGGIYDHIGGGFCRYSTDAFWMVPHFEKTLSDQASLIDAYTRAFLVTGEERFASVARETTDYVLRDLLASNGTFFSGQDADSAAVKGGEKEEGAFYVWRPEQIHEAVGDEAIAQELIDFYGVTASGNFEGSNILHRPNRDQWKRPAGVEAGRETLLNARNKRPAPAVDNKVVTDANAATITALVNLGAACNESRYQQVAQRALDSLLNDSCDNGVPGHVWYRDSGAQIEPTSLDLAQFIIALLAVERATSDNRYLEAAQRCADLLVTDYCDADRGTFYLAPENAHLPVRPKQLIDNGSLSTNSVSAEALYAFGARSGDPKFIQAADNAILGLHKALTDHPTAFVGLLGLS